MSGDQQTARINVTDAEWLDFRTLAMRRRRSLADCLADLVRDEIDRVDRGSRRSDEASTRPSRQTTPAHRTRLADQQLLTRLPRRET